VHSDRGRTRRRWLLLMCVVGLSNVASLTGASESVQRIITIELSGQQRLPVVTTRRIAEQVRTIWRTHGVHVEGLEGPTASPITLYVEISNLSRPPEAGARLELGVFRRTDNRITISLPAAMSIGAPGVPTSESLTWPDFRRDFALGTVLGRAIAHEIGHFLLGPAHSKSGLMRAAFRATEMADPRDGAFDLTRTDVARLAAVLQSAMASPGGFNQRVAAGAP
jgi:hypothetical protein